MYTEGFEGLGEADQGARRTYVSAGTGNDSEKLHREIERLKKALEKEKFFNKLLDQEIQELKSSNQQDRQNGGSRSDYWSGSRKVSRRTFYSLLLITLAMAAYIGYGFYNDKKSGSTTSVVTTPAEPDNTPAEIPADNNSARELTTPVNTDKSNTTRVEENTRSNANKETPPPVNEEIDNTATPATKSTVKSAPPAVVKDSVPNIIASKKVVAKQKTPPAATDEEEYDEAEVEAELAAPVKRSQVLDTKPVVGQYRVTSKANFYNSPDENSMRGTHISQSPDKIVTAFEEKNGFIYVVYTNDLGYTTKGWLSKKDLTKVE